LLLRSGAATLLGGKGVILGVLDGIETSLTEEQVFLQPRDRLVLYTDGLTDVVNNEGELFGLDRLTALLLDHADLDADSMCRPVAQQLDAYRAGAEQADDMTLLIVAAH
jgi:sigma-B regulation protein RsbU (phosphoserine phosphatase)